MKLQLNFLRFLIFWASLSDKSKKKKKKKPKTNKTLKNFSKNDKLRGLLKGPWKIPNGEGQTIHKKCDIKESNQKTWN